MESMSKQQLHRPGAAASKAPEQAGADWVYRGPRQGSNAALYAAAVSSDGK
jgi:hypothetical protein